MRSAPCDPFVYLVASFAGGHGHKAHKGSRRTQRLLSNG